MEQEINSIESVLDNIGVKTKNDELIKEIEKSDFQIKPSKKEPEMAHKIFYGLTDSDRELAAKLEIIPKAYRNASFDTEKIKDNLRRQRKRNGNLYNVFAFEPYIQICEEILSAIRMKQLPMRSYLIGAPNGFGKTSFVNECLITLNRHCFRIAPYISLIELAEIRAEHEHRLMHPYKYLKDTKSEYMFVQPNINTGYQKEPNSVVGKYSWSEYINADCLFVSFSDVISKDIESHTLFQLLNIRANKGLPTIAMISTSLEPYVKDRRLKELVWDEILAYDEHKDNYDRIYHVSCYKYKSTKLENKDMVIDNETGIVYGGNQ